MKKSKFSDEQMVQILREADRENNVTATAKKHGISDQTIYVWRRRFGAMTPDDTRKLKTLESENAKLKKLLADRLLEIDPAGLSGPRTERNLLLGGHRDLGRRPA